MKIPTLKYLMGSLLVLALTSLVGAQNFEPFTPRFDLDVKGDIVLIGNNILGLLWDS